MEGMVAAAAARRDIERAALLKGIAHAFHKPENLDKLTKPRQLPGSSTASGLPTEGFHKGKWW